MITSISNASVKHVAALGRAKGRREQDAFVVEGPKMVSEIPEGDLLKLYVSEEFDRERYASLLHGRSYEMVSARVFREMSDTQTPQGILAVARMRHISLEELVCAGADGNAFILLLEDIQDPGNLGTILRTAEGAGVTGIVMSEGCADIYNPKVVRSTMGAIFRVPFFCTADFHGAVERVRERCKVYAAHLKGEYAYDRGDYAKDTAFLIGNEAKGLREDTASLADTWVRIPMMGKVESLNAAVAASILMYELYRQRRAAE